MSILVTGSSGHLGEALVRTLRQANEEVVSCDLKPGKFTSLVGDIADLDFVRSVMKSASRVIHTATLHKPHVVTHSRQDFINTNISGTQALLSAAVEANVSAFVFTSTTSVFGNAMSPGPSEPAVWVTEDLVPIPKNIYGVTKLAAENLCLLSHVKDKLPVIVLRTSRFFPEQDDNAQARDRYDPDNLKLVELLHRRVDIEDCVDAHLRALSRAPTLGFDRLIVTATTPYGQGDLTSLRSSADKVTEKHAPYRDVFDSLGWAFPTDIGRVYVNERARHQLDWSPRHNFAEVVARVRKGKSVTSPLARAIGEKGYHDVVFADGPFPVD